MDLDSLADCQVTEQGARHKAKEAAQSANPVKRIGSIILGLNHFKVLKVVGFALNWQIDL